MNLLLQSCCRLDRLEIECRIYMGQYANWIPNEQDLAIEPLKLPESELKDLNIKHFDVYWAEEATLLPLLAQCPNLKSLALPDVFSYHDTGICQAIGNHIHSLKQLDLGGTERDDANICSIIEACAGVTPNPATTAIRDRPWEDGFGGLEIFNGGSCGLALKSISALIWGHRMTLRKIEIDYCVRVSNKMLEVILRSCPNLLVLQATMFYMSEQERNSYSPNLEVQAMRSKVLSLRNRHEGYAIKADDSSVDHGPVLELEQGWVSKKLTFLSISYKETEDEAIPEVLFHQIAQLKSLETLVLVCHSTTATTTTTNSLDSLPTGLSALLDINDERGDIHDSVEEKAVAIQKQQQAKMLEQNKRRNIKEALEMFKNELSNLRRFELCGLESYIDPFKWPI
ncbi:hypothetical protein BGZ46_006011 [Entomortierella lignicola]|nr:hypothetical protein BGZ46_006011 [Entomortierella lignicola]